MRYRSPVLIALALVFIVLGVIAWVVWASVVLAIILIAAGVVAGVLAR